MSRRVKDIDKERQIQDRVGQGKWRIKVNESKFREISLDEENIKLYCLLLLQPCFSFSLSLLSFYDLHLLFLYQVSSFTLYPSTFPPFISLFKFHSLACFLPSSKRWRGKVSPTDMSPNKKSRMLRPMDNASLGRRVPWTMRPLYKASLIDLSWSSGYSPPDLTQHKDSLFQ